MLMLMLIPMPKRILVHDPLLYLRRLSRFRFLFRFLFLCLFQNQNQSRTLHRTLHQTLHQTLHLFRYRTLFQ